jgi:hypothetical protein
MIHIHQTKHETRTLLDYCSDRRRRRRRRAWRHPRLKLSHKTTVGRENYYRLQIWVTPLKESFFFPCLSCLVYPSTKAPEQQKVQPPYKHKSQQRSELQKRRGVLRCYSSSCGCKLAIFRSSTSMRSPSVAVVANSHV